MQFAVIFDSEGELKKYVKNEKNNFLSALRLLKFDVPEYTKFVPYNRRKEYKWLFCDRCSLGYVNFLGPLKENEPLFWCPNCSDQDDNDEWIGDPCRLCNGCLQACIITGSRKGNIHPLRLPGGQPIDYFIPLKGKLLAYWQKEFASRSAKIPGMIR
jgi:hypothetical protein